MNNNEHNLLTKPNKPKPDECCGGGSCSPCVWDEYRQALAIWQEQKPHSNTNQETN
ncbi:oxidoreductase-like domain-containing protein (plasmid) [Pseudoalteromonas espejiana]